MCWSFETSVINIYNLKFLQKPFNECSVGRIIFGAIIVLLENSISYNSEQNSDGLSSIHLPNGQDQWDTSHISHMSYNNNIIN